MAEPLTPTELAAIRERNRSLDAYLRETLPAPRVPIVDTRLFSGASTATDDIDSLLATVEAYREIVQVVANADPLTDVAREWAETPGWLNVALDVVWVTKARKLLGTE